MKRLPLILVIVAIACVCAPMLADQSLWMRDILHFSYSQKFYLRERLLHGQLPMWWASDGLGRPFYALVQPGVLYPLNVLWLLPMPFAYNAFSAVHLVVAALGMYAWLRRSDCDELPSALGAAMFALSGYLVSVFADNGTYLFGAAWVPAILATATSARPWQRAGRVGLMLALCLSAGDPQAIFFAGIALAVQALSRHPKELVPVAVAALLAGLIGGALLLPGAVTAAVGRPHGVPIADARHFALHPWRVLELVWPSPFGIPFGPGWQIAPLVDSETRAWPYASSIYCGLAALPLAICALRDRLGRAFAALGLVALVVALGDHTPVWLLVHRFVPLAKTFRHPEKYMMLTSLCLAWLGGRGLQEALREPRRLRVPMIGLFSLATIGLLVTLIDGAGIQRAMVGVASSDPLSHEALRTCVVAALLLVLALRFRPRAFALVTLVEVLLVALRLVAWTPSQTYRDRSPILDEAALASLISPDRPAPRIYRSATQDFSHGASLPALDRATLLPNCGVEDGIAHLDAYYVFHTEAEDDFWNVLGQHPIRLLEWTATRFALLPDSQVLGAHPGLTVRRPYPQLGITLLEVDHPAPHVYLAQRTLPVVDHHDAALKIASGDLVAGQDAVVENGDARTATGACSLVSFSPERMSLSCEASAPSYAIITDTWFPGWRATVDGAATSILVGNAMMRAVPVPAGKHEVVLRYEVPRLALGLVLSVIGLLMALVLARGVTRA